MKKRMSKILSMVLLLGMLLSLLPAAAFAADDGATWQKVELADISADDTVAITRTKGDATWVLPTTGSGSQGQPLVLTGTVSGDTLTVDSTEDFSWTLTQTDAGYTIKSANGASLYLTAANNGVRIGDTEAVWSVTDGYLTAADPNGDTRYLGVYNGQDWRCYTSINNNIKDQTLAFWKLRTDDIVVVDPDPSEEPDPTDTPEPTTAPAAVTATLKSSPADGDKVVIYYPADSKAVTAEEYTYSGKTTKIELTAADATLTEDGRLNVPEGAAILTVSVNGDGKFSFVNEDGKYLYMDTTDLKFVEELGDYTLFELEDAANGHFIKSVNAQYSGKPQYIEYYSGYFTVYGMNASKAEIYTFQFFALDETPEPTPEINTIAEALAGETGAEFTVKGVVTMIETKNVFVQDATGGICLYFDTAPTDLALGDTVIFTGARATYRGLPELTGQTYEKSEGLTLTAKETTIGALTTADVCTYVKLTGLEVTEVYDKNGQFSNPNITFTDAEGKTIQLYKAAIEKNEGVWRVKVGDKVDVTLAVGINNSMLQLRNTLDSEITVKGEEPITVATPTADVAAGEVEKGTVVTFSCETEGAVISYSTDGETWTEGETYTVNEDVTLQVKAVLDGVESAIASFAYTVKAEEPAETEGLVTDLAQLTDGAKIVIYNPNSAKAMSSDVVGSDWYLAPADVTIEGDKAVNPAANLVWTVRVNEDGSYCFEQGDKAVTGWLSGNYVELTSNKSVDGGDSNWSIDPCNAETNTYYIKSSTLANNYGSAYIEIFNKKVSGDTQLVFCGYTTSEEKLTEAAYGMQFYLVKTEDVPPEPVEGDLITSLDQLTDGATVAIYSPSHMTAISSKPNGDWYLKANSATLENGKVVNFTSDFVWKVKVNADGTYSFYSNDDETQCISVWPSGTYAELTVNPNYNGDTVHDWNLLPFSAADHTWYIKSSTLTLTKDSTELPVYIEAFLRNGTEVFSGFAPYTSQLKNTDYALQFYLVNPEDAVAAYDDGEWDGVLEKGKQYVAYSPNAQASLGLAKEATYSLTAVPTTIEGDKAKAGNGAYVFKIDTMGRYYSFEINGKYLASNNAEELFFVEKGEDGKLPDTAKWFLTKNGDSYIIYNREANYNGTPVCIEYYSSVFSGWTFKPKEPDIFLFNFYEVVDGTEIREDVVQDPNVIFDCEDSRFVEQDYLCSFTLDDLAETIETLTVTYTAGDKTGTVTGLEPSKAVSFTIPAAEIDGENAPESFTIKVEVKNSYGIVYSGEKTVAIVDEPFFEELTPAPNAQTRDEKKPTISAKIGNAGENPEFTMTVNGETVEAKFENGVLSYTPAEELKDGRTTVTITVKRSDGVEVEKTWSFTVGIADYQLYFGQLHSHTTYSDGSGSLETALEYIASLPKSANVQFVAFTDHSNYFDTTSAANPADALNDKSLMTESSAALWAEYKDAVEKFNKSQSDIVALAGFEMTWSGGPGHINTFDSDGLVSRNNAELNNKSGDAGMKLYYQTINKGNSLNQFNHPGTTFGNFTDFSYWDEATDAHMFLVEVGNGEGQIGQGGYYPSYEQYIIALDKGWHVAPTNNQDNHKGRWGNANDARDVILTNDFTEQGIYDAIRALRVYATEDKNLQIYYTLNNMPMGTIFSEEETPEKLNINVTLYDPDSSDAVSKVEVVVDGGKTAYTWDKAEELSSGQLNAELEPEYSYYFIRVTQKDGDLAVTAPIWVGKPIKLGITDIKAETDPVYKGEEATLVTTLYNNEEAAATVKSLVYTVNGGEVIGTDTTGYSIPAGGTLPVNFKHTIDTAKLTTVTVTAIVELDGKEYTYTANVELDVLDKETEGKVTPIADVRAASKPDDTGYRFTIEGVVTSNASGYDKDTAFFDCIYVQDDTAGICCFPVSGEYKIGDKVRIVGHTDFYQGEPELQVQTIEVIGEGSVEPTEIKASELNDRSAEGKLVTVKGTVESVEVENGLIQTIMVKDAEGNLARVFIDGYITTGKEVENCEVGAEIKATGLASYDDTFNAPEGPFPRIRIRDRADVVCTLPATDQPAAPTVTPEAGEVEKGTQLTFSSETEGAEIEYSTDGGKTWTKGDKFTVNEDVTIQVKAVKDGVESEIATFKFTVKEEEPKPTESPEPTESPAPIEEPLHIVLDANGGKVSVTRLRLGVDGTVPALPTPQERDGYLFGGWFDAAEGGLEVVQGDKLTESTTLYAHWYELRAVATNNTVVPTALKERYATVDAMKTAMLNTLKRRLGTTTVKGNKLYEIQVEYFDGSEWLPITADQFPTKGVKVSIAVPDGAAATDRFVALHLFGEDCNGHKAGEGEMPTVTKSGSTLSFTVHGTSPLLLVWTGTSSGGSGGKTPKTGDDANLGLWIALMAASSAAMAVLVIEQKKRKNRA